MVEELTKPKKKKTDKKWTKADERNLKMLGDEISRDRRGPVAGNDKRESKTSYLCVMRSQGVCDRKMAPVCGTERDAHDPSCLCCEWQLSAHRSTRWMCVGSGYATRRPSSTAS